MELFDGLYLYEVVMLFLGAFLFIVLVLALVYQMMHKRSFAGLLLFFVLSIVMMGYPSIKSVQVQNDTITIDKTTHDLQSKPADAQVRSELEKEVAKVSARPISDPAALTRLANAPFALGNEKAAEPNVQQARQHDPIAAGAQELQKKIIAVQKLDSMVTQVEKDPGDPAAKQQLQQTLSQASQQPTANPAALTKIAKAQIVLGQQEKATENVNKALQINPNLTEAKKVQTSILANRPR
jgi:tetratricopeptide (TPR) repeat protein